MRFLEFLLEQANYRKDVEGEITNLAKPLIEHLIKILKWDDKLNFNKHCNDIDNWILSIQQKKIKGGKLPKQKDYYQWIFYDTVSDIRLIKKWIRVLKNYHQLIEIRTDEEVFFEIERIIKQLCKDLSLGDTKDIKDYL